ncbi:MAG TPA: SPOR domain-containing protein, partial [Flavobacterium sp.]|nr:SPOR domain-containing protein [Flavobacterium sp.]
MRFLRTLKALSLFTLFLITTNRITAQNSNLSVNQDPKFEQLLNEKRKSNTNLSYSDRYKIQIF